MLTGANWIENPSCPASAAPIFRKTFSVLPFAKAQLAICGLGFYVCRLNGRRVSEDQLTPPFTAYDKTVLYQVYDLTDCLQVGENMLEIICGNGWYNQQEADAWEFQNARWKAGPKAICRLEVDGRCCVVTDRSWETAVSRWVFNSHRLGETYDASLPEPRFMPATLAQPPEGVLKPQQLPPIRLQGVYQAKQLTPHLYDFGESVTGNVAITVQGKAGDKVVMRYSERLYPDGTLDRENVSEHTYAERFAQDEYVLGGDGTENWHGEFSFHGFRYVQIDCPASVTLLSVTARDLHTDLALVGDYTCDNESINRLHRACMRSVLTNYLHIPMDCPHREKNGWTADTMLSSFQALYSLELRSAYEKWLDDLVDCQRENGAVPCIAPTSLWGYGWGSGVTWDAALFMIPWNVYRFTGDLSLIRRFYGAMTRYLPYLETLGTADIFSVGLGDWNAPKGESTVDDRALLTCMAKHVFGVYAQMSERLGYSEQAAYAFRRAGEIRQAFQQAFADHPPCQTFDAAVVYFDMTDDKPAAVERLAESVRLADGHIRAGIFGAYIVPCVLRDHGYFDLAWEMVTKETYPSWIDMMNRCHGALGKWDGTASLDHHMFSSIDGFIQGSLSGLSIHHGEAGFSPLCLKPYFPNDMANFSFWHQTDRGRIAIEWDQNEYRVTLPEGMDGTVEINSEIHRIIAGENRIRR